MPTLRFRAANARGLEVVDASITVSALIEAITPEDVSATAEVE